MFIKLANKHTESKHKDNKLFKLVGIIQLSGYHSLEKILNYYCSKRNSVPYSKKMLKQHSTVKLNICELHKNNCRPNVILVGQYNYRSRRFFYEYS